VRDEQDRHPELLLQAVEQLEDLRLDRDVERGRRLVGDEERGWQASAIAIMTRWRMPPDSWCGYSSTRCSGDGMPTSAASRSRGARLRLPTFWCSRTPR
jgi:hypothetical protein